MNIEMIDDTETADVIEAELMERAAEIASLDDDSRQTLASITRVVLNTLTHKQGTVVVMADVLGNGVAEIIACGNPALVPALLYTASAAADAMFKPNEAPIQ